MHLTVVGLLRSEWLQLNRAFLPLIKKTPTSELHVGSFTWVFRHVIANLRTGIVP